MNEEKKAEMIAMAENVEAIENFLKDSYSVEDLFETAANAGSMILEFASYKLIAPEDMKHLTDLIDQHVMLANLLKPFARKEE